jgi:hypothetical protein
VQLTQRDGQGLLVQPRVDQRADVLEDALLDLVVVRVDLARSSSSSIGGFVMPIGVSYSGVAAAASVVATMGSPLGYCLGSVSSMTPW